jgi:glycosyltransferase involved in cell wall biosynthesis
MALSSNRDRIATVRISEAGAVAEIPVDGVSDGRAWTGPERPLRIAILAPCWFPVPPPRYGGIETVVALLADGLVEAGHEVTLFASGESQTTARLVAAYDTAPSEEIGRTHWELRHALSCLDEAAAFDVVHDHTGMLGLLLGGLASTPLVHTVHGPLDGEPGELYEVICSLVPRPLLVSLSLNQRKPHPHLPWIANCPNAIDVSRYPPGDHAGEYLLFLGRMSPEKGCHGAIRAARTSGLPLKIAAKMREPSEEDYFQRFVEPELGNGVEFVGEVGYREKLELLQHARATLFPIDWEEPFGLVMLESMACGTPVVATRRGSVPEVVVDGKTGIIVGTSGEMASALTRIDRIDPDECRRHVETHFAPERMVTAYERAYRLAVARACRTDTRRNDAVRAANPRLRQHAARA